MRSAYHGGRNAREWRRQIAALARNQKESVATYKFKLDTHADSIDFDAASQAYNITEGTALGSLMSLVCAIHLSGFRLFPNSGEAKQFRNKSRYPSREFAEALKKHTGIETSGITVPSLEKAFGTPPRKRGGGTLAWSAENLAKRLFQAWHDGRMPRDNDTDRLEFEFAMGIAAAVAGKFDGWHSLAKDVTEALACTDEYLSSRGQSFPKLSALPPETDFQPSMSTFAYDPDACFVDMADTEHIWLHQAVAVCAGRIKRDSPDLEAASAAFPKRLNKEIATQSQNGLQWLFGRGLQYLRTSDAKSIAEDLCVPDSGMRQVEQLKKFADAIPDNPFFKAPHYAEFRNSVGGKITSWVSNYWNRIRELDALRAIEQQIDFPDALLGQENAFLFSGQHSNAAALKALWQRLPERIGRAGEVLSVLKGGGIPTPDDIAAVEQVAADVTEFAGQIAMLRNRLEQEAASTEEAHDTASLESIKERIDRKAEELEELPKLNRISGGALDASHEIKQLERNLNTVLSARRKHFERLEAWARDRTADPMESTIARERTELADCGKDQALAKERAIRRVLRDISGLSRRLSRGTAQKIQGAVAPLFSKPRDANLYFYNRLGSIYRHPRSRSRHQAYAIDIDRASQIDWLEWLEDLEAELREQLGGDADQALWRDLLLVEGFILAHKFDGLPDSVPGALARPDIGEEIVRIPPLLAAELDAEEVSRGIAKRAFNLFANAINGLMSQVFRDSFVIRVKFQRASVEELFYVPKDRTWSPPDGYRTAKGDISKGLALSAVAMDPNGSILAGETVRGLSSDDLPEPGARALLHQIPHDWFVELNLHKPVEEAAHSGLPVKKNGEGIKVWRKARHPVFRLIGPPSFKTWLDQSLIYADVKLGDYTLIIDRFYRQSLQMQGDRIVLAAEPDRLRAEIAVPVIDGRPYPESHAEHLFDNIVAIDLGEKRIGYAVFSLADMLEHGTLDPIVGDDGNPVVGTVAIPPFRKLMSAVRRHRNTRQPNQKVNQTYSKALMRFRENVVGDVCNRIDTLCARFQAFPILERIEGFETGGNQLKLIYGSVLRRYTYSPVDAHKRSRQHYWNTANSWDHPYMKIRKWNPSTRSHSGSSRQLAIHPGYKVHPAGTSQTCHRCGRNAITALRAMPDRLRVESGGRIALGDGTVRLLHKSSYSKADLKLYRRRNERPPLNTPMPEGLSAKNDLERIAKRNMRQPPKSEMSPDTSQARFACVYEDCGYEGHADENAAINIGRRFLEQVDAKGSKEAWDALTKARNKLR